MICANHLQSNRGEKERERERLRDGAVLWAGAREEGRYTAEKCEPSIVHTPLFPFLPSCPSPVYPLHIKFIATSFPYVQSPAF